MRSEADDGGRILRARDLTIDYPIRGGSLRAVDGFEVELGAREIVGIFGETGSGKSTAALALMGLVRKPGRIVAGAVLYRGSNLLAKSEAELRKIRGTELSLVVQNPRAALNPLLRVGDQIADVCRAHRQLTAREAKAEALVALAEVGINDPGRRARAYPHELSGGMAQRVMIAMATVNRPKVVIADEPTTGLDVTVQAQILSLLRSRVVETGSAVLLVSHDLGVIAHYCDRAIVMFDGRIVESADVKTLFSSPRHAHTQLLISAAPRFEWLLGDEASAGGAALGRQGSDGERK
jgi:ABC-type dipeptide/oligopeptide/nickel transport system ATPase component